MPTVLRVGPYRFFFYAGDRREPAHIHVRRNEVEAKFWLEPVSLTWNRGFREQELRKIRRLVVQHQATLVQEWNDYFAA